VKFIISADVPRLARFYPDLRHAERGFTLAGFLPAAAVAQ